MERMQPDAKLAERVLPKPLYRAIAHVFAHCGEGVALVGGTALAGFYAGHRRSDDMDLFAKDELAFRGAVLAIKSLKNLGARISEESQSPLYYHALCELDGHTFTADAVLDENLFRVGKFHRVEGIVVADLETLLAMKVASLVSRGSEKDLFDLSWLRERYPNLGVAELAARAQAIDGGAQPESMLGVLGGTELREGACDFSLDPQASGGEIFKAVKDERKAWIEMLRAHLRKAAAPPIAVLVREVKRGK